MIKVEEIELPENLKEIPQIDFGEDFKNFDDARKIRYLKLFSSAMNDVADKIQIERDQLLNELHKLKIVLENADKAVSIQKNIVLQAITAHNQEKQELINRLQELEIKVREQETLIEVLENGGNNKLEH